MLWLCFDLRRISIDSPNFKAFLNVNPTSLSSESENPLPILSFLREELTTDTKAEGGFLGFTTSCLVLIFSLIFISGILGCRIVSSFFFLLTAPFLGTLGLGTFGFLAFLRVVFVLVSLLTPNSPLTKMKFNLSIFELRYAES